MQKGQLAVITFVDPSGRPIDPGYGIEGGHPSTGPIFPGGPVDPGYGHPGGGGHPGIWPPPPPPIVWPPSPVDPDWGVNAPPYRPSLPIYIPIGPGHPDNSLPPVLDHKPVEPAEPGYIWPPLPPGLPPGKVAILVAISGVGYRYAVLTIPPPSVTPPIAPPSGQPKDR